MTDDARAVAYRAAIDRNAAEALAALTARARLLNHLDQADAVEALALALVNSRMPREQLGAVLAALAIRVVRRYPDA